MRRFQYFIKLTCYSKPPRAPEILFKPELIGQDQYGMHESIFKSILKSDIDLRRCFLGNIVLSGNSCLLLACHGSRMKSSCASVYTDY